MPLYRKKTSSIVTAFQWTGRKEDCPEWFLYVLKAGGAYTHWPDDEGEVKSCLVINSPGCFLEANVGDYIVKGDSGELRPHKPDIFEKIYEIYN